MRSQPWGGEVIETAREYHYVEAEEVEDDNEVEDDHYVEVESVEGDDDDKDAWVTKAARTPGSKLAFRSGRTSPPAQCQLSPLQKVSSGTLKQCEACNGKHRAHTCSRARVTVETPAPSRVDVASTPSDVCKGQLIPVMGAGGSPHSTGMDMMFVTMPSCGELVIAAEMAAALAASEVRTRAAHVDKPLGKKRTREGHDAGGSWHTRPFGGAPRNSDGNAMDWDYLRGVWITKGSEVANGDGGGSSGRGGGGSSSGGGKDRVVAVEPMAVKAEEGTDELMPTPPGSTVWLHTNAASVTGYKGVLLLREKGKKFTKPYSVQLWEDKSMRKLARFGSALEGAVFYSEYLRITGRHLHPGAAGTDLPQFGPGSALEMAAKEAVANGLKLYPSCKNALGYRGIFYDQNRAPQHRFTASASQNGRNRVLGRFGTAIEAAVCYAQHMEAEARSPGRQKGHR